MSDGIVGSGPAHVPKTLALLLLVAAVVYWLRGRVDDTAERTRFSRGAVLGAGALLAGVIALAALLERFPGNSAASGKPSFRETRVLEAGREVTVEGEVLRFSIAKTVSLPPP